jgi:hypothetical protein
MSLRDDLNWATKIYLERLEDLEADQNFTYFFLRDYQEILSGSGLIVVSFDSGGDVASRFADTWFETTVVSLREGLSNQE